MRKGVHAPENSRRHQQEGKGGVGRMDQRPGTANVAAQRERETGTDTKGGRGLGGRKGGGAPDAVVALASAHDEVPQDLRKPREDSLHVHGGGAAGET